MMAVDKAEYAVERNGVTVEQAIARCAEQILKMLVERGEVNVLLLSERLGERSVITYQALGWLACEKRVHYEARENQVYVSAPRP
jgi:hypothetical protein